MANPANTPAKLTHGGIDTSTTGPSGNASAATNVPDPDSDAAEAVAEMLKETGADRSAIEGKPAGLALDKEPPPASVDKKPAEDKKPTAISTIDKDGKPVEPVTAAASPEPTDADLELNLTAEDLAAIEKDPLLKKTYKVMVRGLNKKMMEVAERRKGADAELDIIAKVKQNPVAGLQALAAVVGVPIQIGAGDIKPQPTAEPVKSPIDLAEAKLAEVLTPEGAKALRPALEALLGALLDERLEKRVAPLESTVASGQRLQAETQLDRSLANYGRAVEARGDDWSEEIQTAMSELVGKILPGKGTTLNDYLDVLYDRVTGERSRASVKQRQLQRLRDAAGATEPVHAARSTATRASDQQITAGMDDEEATALAVRQTLEEMGVSR